MHGKDQKDPSVCGWLGLVLSLLWNYLRIEVRSKPSLYYINNDKARYKFNRNLLTSFLLNLRHGVSVHEDKNHRNLCISIRNS